MEAAARLIDLVLHVDRHLLAFVGSQGHRVYALLLAVIIVETKLAVMPFLPGDPRLFVVGAPCGLGLLNLPLTMWHS
jgi:membrane-associated protein